MKPTAHDVLLSSAGINGAGVRQCPDVGFSFIFIA
jgi:hypothetical protein